jgi:ABC-type Mn2+/Zn2+ transport system permease subunit/Mn-dependent DtxR family transcriptional regulator
MNGSFDRVLLEPLRQIYFQEALIGGCLIAVACGVIGCFVILRRMAFLGDALAHAMLAGVTAGYLFMKLLFDVEAHSPAMLIGSLLAAIVTVGMIGGVARLSRIKEDAAIGIMYTGIFAIGGALASMFAKYVHVDLLHFITGQVLAVSDTDLWFSAIVTAGVLTAVILLFRHLQITTFDPVMAASIGVPVVAIDYLLTTCTSLVVVCAVQMVGVILVVGLLVTPAASAYLLCDRLSRMLMTSAALGVTGIIGGLYLSLWMNIAGGSAIVLFITAQFFVVFAIAPRYGLIADWRRKRQMVPQTLVEDVLRCIQKSRDGGVSMKTLQTHIEARPDAIARAVQNMQRRDLIEASGDSIALTEDGKLEAKRILRAHRLWETYLQHVGLPESQLHEQAHLLEHVHDEDAVDYLDEKLGHPLTDPHGAEIPEDFVHLVPGNRVSVSLLREGHTASIHRVGRKVTDERLQAGIVIRMGPRRGAGDIWSIILPDGAEIELSHAAADDLIVEVQ